MEQNAFNLSEAWLVISGALVLFMQAGFSMLEAGSVRSKSTVNILFKNILDAGIGALTWWILGYGLAFGEDKHNSYFAGSSHYALADVQSFADISADVSSGKTGSYSMFFFQYTFAATAATIVSGAVAERTKLNAYLAYSVIITGLIYPIVVFWGWNGGFNESWKKAGGVQFAHDFAGSGIVHLVGGASGLVGAIFVGARADRFDPETGAPKDIPGHNVTLQALGTFILWFGWYGFNCGSGSPAIAGKVATTTTLGAAGALIAGTIIAKLFKGTWDVAAGLNSILAGLVSITAGANVIEAWGAFIAGILGAIIYASTSHLLLKLKIDDPLDAFAVHGACGFWGLLVVGIFGTSGGFKFSGSAEDGAGCLDSGGCADVLLANLCFGLSILLWTIATTTVVFGGIKLLGKVSPRFCGLRVSDTEEIEGLDISEHGARAYGIEISVLEKGEGAPMVPKPKNANTNATVSNELDTVFPSGTGGPDDSKTSN